MEAGEERNVKNVFYLGAVALVLSLPAGATLIGDEVGGSASGMTTFNTGAETVDGTFVPEFAGTIVTLDGAGNPDSVFSASFDFDEATLLISVSRDLSGDSIVPDFTVTFTDLNWVGLPGHILTGVSINYDNPTEFLGGTPGQGLATNVDVHSLQLVFTDFALPEFREIELQLASAEGPTDPIPEPGTAALLLVGLAGLIARRARA